MDGALTQVDETPVVTFSQFATHTALDLPKGLPFDQWTAIGEQLKSAERSLMWWVGDWWAFGEFSYGERFSQALDPDQDGYQYQTLRNAGWVSSSIEPSRRRDNLSWSHHMEVAGLDPKDQDRFLQRAVDDALSVHGLRREVKDWNRGVVREQQSIEALGTGKFSVIYADPPWSYSNSGLMGSADEHYPTMATDQICEMALSDKATDDAVLFLWATNPCLTDAMKVIEAWGFDYKTNFAWVKDKGNYGKLGFYNYGRHELLLVCTRGSFTPSGDLPDSVIDAPKSKHSKKPTEVYDLIESLYPHGPYLEMFARAKREGWTSFGNEVTP